MYTYSIFGYYLPMGKFIALHFNKFNNLTKCFGSGELKMTKIKMLVDNDKEYDIKSACL